MILVDTSVWVEFFRGRDRGLCDSMKVLLDDDQVALAIPVRIEILSGCSSHDLQRVRKLLSALPLSYPADSTWSLMEEWVKNAAHRGKRFGIADLLIAAIASENSYSLWSLDSDFNQMAAMGWLKLFAI